jgi:hypothetical protein
MPRILGTLGITENAALNDGITGHLRSRRGLSGLQGVI